MCSKRASDGRWQNVKGRSCFHVCKQTKKLRNLLQKRGTEVHPIDRYDYLNMRKDHRYHRHLPRNTSSKTSEKPRGNHWRHVGTSLQHQNPPSTYRLKNRDLSHRTSRGNSASHTIQLQRLQHWNSGVRNQNRTNITQNPPNPAKTGLPFFSGATKIGRKHQNPERETTIFALWDALTAKRRMGVEEGFRRAMAEARAGDPPVGCSCCLLRWESSPREVMKKADCEGGTRRRQTATDGNERAVEGHGWTWTDGTCGRTGRGGSWGGGPRLEGI